MASKSEMAEKERRARAIMDENGLGALVLSSQANFAWITCGGDNHVSIASEGGVASVVITRDAKYIVCDNIEAARIMDEETVGQGFEHVSCDWWEDKKPVLIREIADGKVIGSDMPMPDAAVVEKNIAMHRRSLTPEEIDRYRLVGQATAVCMSEACRAIVPGMTEFEIAAVLDEEVVSRGMIPNVTLIAVDDRISKYRHPIPTNKKLEKYAMLVVGARKWGLILSATRLVHFGKISDELRRKHNAVVEVDAAFISATRTGTRVGKVFVSAQEAYARTGFADEWQLHHQGGPTGYLARDYRANANTEDTVQPNQAFAWNPSITGTKSEDTVIAMEAGTEVLSIGADWPLIDVEVDGRIIPRPDILEL